METMKAVRIHHYGGPDALHYEDALRPEPGEGEVRVRVHAAGVNPRDWKVREGYVRGHTLPLILGWDLSGVIETIGPGVTRFAAGDDVYAHLDLSRDGAYAECVLVRESELAHKPRSIGHITSAAVPLAALTAWQALFEAPPPTRSIGLVKGQTLLIHGAAGGVGSFAVQLARWRGANVIATGSAHNEEFLRDLGAHHFVDYARQRFENVVHNADAVLDTIGGETQTRSWGVLKRGGVLVSTTGPPSMEAAGRYGVRAASFLVQPIVSQLDQITRLIDDRVVRPILSDVFPLAEARRAHRLSQAGHVRGKIVLSVANGKR